MAVQLPRTSKVGLIKSVPLEVIVFIENQQKWKHGGHELIRIGQPKMLLRDGDVMLAQYVKGAHGNLFGWKILNTYPAGKITLCHGFMFILAPVFLVYILLMGMRIEHQ